jgi:hypothetical protein
LPSRQQGFVLTLGAATAGAVPDVAGGERVGGGLSATEHAGRLTGNSDVLVALNCNGVFAGAGSAGNSALSPEGRDAKQEAAQDAATSEEQQLAEAATPGA